MAKKFSYISPKRVLTEKEYQEYRQAKEMEARRRFLSKTSKISSENKYAQRSESYNKSKAGRIGRFISKVYRPISTRGGVTRALYRRTGQLTYNQRSKSYGKVGRPRGSYDPRYAQYGGVYGYRKMLSASLQAQRMETLRNASLNPQQKIILQRIEARQQYNRSNKEARVIPDTDGNVYLNGIFDEIDKSSNLVG